MQDEGEGTQLRGEGGRAKIWPAGTGPPAWPWGGRTPAGVHRSVLRSTRSHHLPDRGNRTACRTGELLSWQLLQQWQLLLQQLL